MINYRDNSKTMRQVHAPAPGVDRIRAFLLQIVDGGLAGVIFIVPFMMGGRHPLGQLILVALTVVIALAWAVRQCLRPRPVWRPSWALALLSAGAILIVLQMIPLTQSMMEWFAPRHGNILPLWNAGQSGPASLGPWTFLSFTPAETQASLVLFLAYGLLFFVTVQRIKIIQDVERLLRWCAISVVCMAVFGLVQYLAGNGKFFWFHSDPFASTSDGAKGSFTNRNHFAHFLALGAGPLIWWLLHFYRRNQSRIQNLVQISTRGSRSGELETYLLGLALAVVLFAGLMSLSRGGIAALFLAAVVSTAICFWASASKGGFLGIMLASCVLIGVALSVFGLDRVNSRLETLTSDASTQKDRFGGRLEIWSAAAKAIPDCNLLGFGAGSFREVFPMYVDTPLTENIEVTHAENSYLHDLLETGVIGLGLVLAGIALWSYWCAAGCKGDARIKVCAGAIAGSLAAGTFQALVDFVWYVPACMAIMAIFAACALRLSQFAAANPKKARPSPISRMVPVAAVILILPMGTWMIQNRIGPALAQPSWDQYLIALKSQNAAPTLPDNADSTARRDAIDAAIQKEKTLIEFLEKTVFWQPTHAGAHLALAEAHLRLFDKLQATSANPMTLVNIRDAALESEFSSREALCAWLARALGNHWVHLDAALRHTRRAISLCPLQGRGYIYLARLCFLEGLKDSYKQACVTQALRVRPFDGVVVSAAAAEALLAGNSQQWLVLSKHAFRCGRSYQHELITNLVANTPPEGIQGIIDFIVTQFQPDFESLQFLYALCQKRVGAEALLALCRYQALQAEFEARSLNNADAAAMWLEAQRRHTQLNDGQRALECARRALACDQNNYWVHYQLAMCLINQELFAEAESHLHWCLQRTPGDQSLAFRLKEALKGKLDSERCAAAQRGNNL
jgi:O-antigen ligase/tetratricopeptide (TPR) repeat protein